MRWQQTLSQHWPEYLIEGWALGSFMISAGLFTMLVEHPLSPLHGLILDADLRRILIGIAMGLTAIGLIYSPWGQRSGAHMNPAVTLSYWSLGKVTASDALGYVVAQFVGGTLGVLLLWAIGGPLLSAPPVNFVITAPGAAGIEVAFVAEVAISFLMMTTVLTVSNHSSLARFTPLFAGSLVALYISVEAPLSGMSMNPARSFASAAPAGAWQALWIYFSAPVLGMLSAAYTYRRFTSGARVACAKLLHPDDQPCIHCGHVPISKAASSMGAQHHVL